MTRRTPKTDVGKTAVRRKAAKHAMLSFSPVIRGMENEDDWIAARDGVVESLRPEGYLELMLAERVALILWRLNRVARFETEVLNIDQDRIEEGQLLVPQRASGGAEVTGDSEAEELDLLDDEVARAVLDGEMVRGFLALEDDAEVPETMAMAVLDVIIAVFRAAAKASGSESADEPSLPEGRTTGRELWSILAKCQPKLPSPAKEILQMYVSMLERMLENHAALKIERQRSRSLSLLPAEASLGRIQRYEAHLERQFLQTLHELEAFQSRRRGEPAPLARVDIQGVPEG